MIGRDKNTLALQCLGVACHANTVQDTAQITKKAKKHSNSLCSIFSKSEWCEITPEGEHERQINGGEKKPALPRRLVLETGYEERTD